MTFLKYSFSGILSYLLYIILLVISIEVADFEKLVSSIVTYGMAIIFNFCLLKFWVFKFKKNTSNRFIKYNIVGLAGYFLNTLGFYILIIKFELNYLYSQLFLFFFISFSNYIFNIFWTFKTENLDNNKL